MLEKTAASLEPCGFQWVVPGASQSYRRPRPLRAAFWQHGAADIELSNAWQSLMHGTLELSMGPPAEERKGSALSASTFLLDFLYPSGAATLTRHLTSYTGVSFSRPNSLRYGNRLLKPGPRLYSSSLPKQPSKPEPTSSHESRSLGDGDPIDQIDTQYTEETSIRETGKLLSTPVDDEDQLGSNETHETPVQADIAVDDANHSGPSDDHIKTLESLLETKDPEDVDRVWHYYKLLEEQTQTNYLSQVLVVLSKSGRLSDSWKISELFHGLPLSQWTDQIFIAGITAEINLQNADPALEVFIKGLDHGALSLPSLVDALDLLLANALRSENLEILSNLWRYYPKMTARWDYEGIASQLKGIASVASLAVLGDVWKYYPQLAGRWNFEGITSQLKHVALVPRLADRALKFQVRDRQKLLEMGDTGLGEEALDTLQRILVRRALVSCDDSQVIPLLDVTKDPLAFEEFLRTTIARNKKMLGTRVYNIYRDLPGSVPSHPVLHEMFKAYKGLNAAMSVKYAGIEMLWGDWHKFHTTPSRRAFQRYLAFYASRGETVRVYELWGRFVKLFLDDPDLPVLQSDDTFAHILQVHAVRGESEETQRIFDDITRMFGITPDSYQWNILLNAYSKAGDYDGALTTFENCTAAGKLSQYSYGTMMQMSAERGDMGLTLELYRRGQSHGMRADEAILCSLVEVYCQNNYFETAESVCIRAAKRGIAATRMCNKLVHAYSRRRDLASVNRVLNLMTKKDIPYDSYTYHHLLHGLVVCKQAHHALDLLLLGLKDKVFEVKAEHFHIVMGALLITGQPAAVIRLHRVMLSHGFPSSSDSLFRLSQALGQWRKFRPERRTRLGSIESLGEALRSFNNIYGLNNREELSKLPPPKADRVQSNELFRQNTEEYRFSAMIYMFTQLNDLVRARELADLYRYVFQGQRDLDGVLPVAMLNSVMLMDLEEGKHDRVRATWHHLFETAKKEGQSADYREDLPDSPKISAKYRYILSGGLEVMLKLLFTEGDAAGLQSLVQEVRSEGFELDSKIWNYYVQVLARLQQFREAFVICETILMPNWTGWYTARHREQMRNQLPLDLRRKGMSPRHLRPTATTLYRLAKGYMELDRLSPWSAEAAREAQDIEKECVQVVRAIKSMKQVHSQLELEIFSEGEQVGRDMTTSELEANELSEGSRQS
ncbi:hypothetical protein GGR54DRAFT_616615 [Hypoxylon sp. NC1633]|nr:hypothetical protein GGR54DRAFT_616615 [Hypoxylon sp. NC1633]